MKKHLRFDLYSWTGPHPQEQMRKLGIVYQHATPQSLGDQWWFWNCENIPDPMPEYLSIADLDPMKCIGYGLSREDAIAIQKGAAEGSNKGKGSTGAPAP